MLASVILRFSSLRLRASLVELVLHDTGLTRPRYQVELLGVFVLFLDVLDSKSSRQPFEQTELTGNTVELALILTRSSVNFGAIVRRVVRSDLVYPSWNLGNAVMTCSDRDSTKFKERLA